MILTSIIDGDLGLIVIERYTIISPSQIEKTLTYREVYNHIFVQMYLSLRYQH